MGDQSAGGADPEWENRKAPMIGRYRQLSSSSSSRPALVGSSRPSGRSRGPRDRSPSRGHRKMPEGIVAENGAGIKTPFGVNVPKGDFHDRNHRRASIPPSRSRARFRRSTTPARSPSFSLTARWSASSKNPRSACSRPVPP